MKRKIMVVDDEPDLRDLFTDFFAEFGYEVTAAGDAEEALNLVDQDPAQVIFLDLNLPGMDGLELCRRLRHIFPQAQIFALTGYHKLFTVEAARDVGFSDYFTKPVDLHLLHNVARAAFEKLEGSATKS